MSDNLESEWAKDSIVGLMNERRTAVHTTGEGVVQTPLEGRGEPLNYLFVPGIRREHLHTMYRTSQTSVHSFSTVPSLFGHVASGDRPGSFSYNTTRIVSTRTTVQKRVSFTGTYVYSGFLSNSRTLASKLDSSDCNDEIMAA